MSRGGTIRRGARFRRLLDARVALIHEQRRAAGFARSMGVAAVLAQDPRKRAGDTFPTFARNPRIACLSREARIGLLAGLREWRGRYRSALEGWRRGDRTVVFPRGSYALPRWHAARVQALAA